MIASGYVIIRRARSSTNCNRSMMVNLVVRLTCIVVQALLWQEPFKTTAAFVVDSRHHRKLSLQPKRLNPSSTTTTISLLASSWDAIDAMFGEAWSSPTPSSIDSVLQPETPTFSTQRPTLFRERHGWCPYSERVWLTLELLNIDYDTIRIDNTGGPRPSYFGGGQTPQMKWPSGKTQGESYDLVQVLDREYGTCNGKLDLQSDSSHVTDIVNQFRSIFPRARPSSRASYLFQYNGEPLWRSTFEQTLEQTNELLSNNNNNNNISGGPFFGGSSVVTAADIAWAPFLERYRYQLPCLHPGLQPDNASDYPHLAAWYQAMDQLPAYACRVKGDASSWRKVLTMAGFGNAGVPPQIMGEMQSLAQAEAITAANAIQQDVWSVYRSSRPYVESTPAAEAALIVTRNRRAIVQDIVKQTTTRQNRFDLPTSVDELDAILRDMVLILVQSKPGKEYGIEWDTTLSTNFEMVGRLASFLDERMCVPRDMGAMSAACIKDLAWKLHLSQ